MGWYVSGAARNWRVFSPGEISQQHVEKLRDQVKISPPLKINDGSSLGKGKRAFEL